MALRSATWVFGVLVLSATTARAEMPAGVYTIPIGGDAGLVWPSEDVSGLCIEGLCIDGSLETSTSGAISGAATMNGEVQGIVVELDLGVGGQVSGSTAKPKVAITLDIDGTAEYQGQSFTVTGSGRQRCGLDRLDPSQLQCKGRLKLCLFDGARKLGCDSAPVSGGLPFQRVPFEVALDLATSEKNAVTGTSEVSIEAAPVLACTAKGKYKPSSDTTTVKLAGVDPAAKTRVTVSKTVLASGGASGGVVRFKIAGQRGKLTLPAP